MILYVFCVSDPKIKGLLPQCGAPSELDDANCDNNPLILTSENASRKGSPTRSLQNEQFFKFAINDNDIKKLILNNIEFEVVHENLQQFYESRLIQDYESRDFEFGSMGGYYFVCLFACAMTALTVSMYVWLYTPGAGL